MPGCKMCKLYARPGLHIYRWGSRFLQALKDSSVVHVFVPRSIHMETHMEAEETPVKKSSRATPHGRATPYARTSSRARRNSTVELEEAVEEIKEKEEEDKEEEEENQCGNCGMAFDTGDLLETHEDEVHDQRKNKFSGGFMIIA